MKNPLPRFVIYTAVIAAALTVNSAFAQDNLTASLNNRRLPVGKENEDEKIVTAGEKKEEAKPEDVKKEKEEEEGPKFSVNGYLDSYYFTNFNKPASRDNMGISGVGRGFDRRVDQFQLGMIQTVLKYTNKKSEMIADIAYGPSAQYGNYGNVPNFSPAYGYAVGNDTWTSILIKQAYFKYNASDKLSFTMGQFGTHIGYELIEASLNYFYSINHTFNSGIPFYHTGLKSTYAFSDKVSLMLGVVNGFDYVHDNNRAKGVIGQLALAPVEGLTMYLNYISSNEANADAQGNTPKGNFTVYDLNGVYTFSEKFYMGYWVMLGTQHGALGAPGTFLPADGDVESTKKWYGANLYLVYNASDLFSIGVRAEHFNNDEGARGLRSYNSATETYAGTSANTFTFTGTFNLAEGNLMIKPELRIDAFKKLDGTGLETSQQFMDSDGNFTKSGQTTLGFAAIYKF
ncbi:MAG TPA: outer membrane beta-barrel protein [Cyclobacteriaceae bacterium]|nr:outer membrane beta-barrel protein [Cyclobacteriaceae bacterium]